MVVDYDWTEFGDWGIRLGRDGTWAYVPSGERVLELREQSGRHRRPASQDRHTQEPPKPSGRGSRSVGIRRLSSRSELARCLLKTTVMELKQIAKQVLSTHPGATVREAAELMASGGAAAIVILDGEKLVGILSARDVVERAVARRLDPETTRVSEIMTPRVLTITEGTSVRDIVDRMEGQCRHLPLVDVRGCVTGMLTMGYLLGERVGELSLQNADLVGFISTDGPGG